MGFRIGLDTAIARGVMRTKIDLMSNVDYAVAIMYAEGHVLLGKRAPGRLFHPDIWDLIGGRLESGESPDSALGRELSEELGVEATSYHLVGIETAHDTRYYVYLISEWNGIPFNKATQEHTEIRWFSIYEIAEEKPLRGTYVPRVLDTLANIEEPR